MQLSCPVCKVPLTKKEIGSAVYHVCESHGVWATIGFFSKFKGTRTIGASIFQARRFIVDTGEEKLKCPQCLYPMKATQYKHVDGLVIDQCVYCNGVWFDSGELNSIPYKSELEAAFKHRPLQKTIRTETEAKPQIHLGDGVPDETDINPLMFFGLPAEQSSRRAAGMSITVTILCLVCIFVSVKGWQSQEFMKNWQFDPKSPMRSGGLTMITSALLHSGFWHLFSNLYFLYITGDDVEDIKGPYFLMGLFFAAAITAHIIYAASGAINPTIGASGGVAAVMAFYAMSFPDNKFRFLGRRIYGLFTSYAISARNFLFFYLVMQAIYYFMSAHGMRSRINYLAHIVGITVGLIAYVMTNEQHSSQD